MLRTPKSAYQNSDRRFCANLLKLPDIDLHVNVDFALGFLIHNQEDLPAKPRFALRKISKSDQTKNPEPLRLAGDHLLGLQMACSL